MLTPYLRTVVIFFSSLIFSTTLIQAEESIRITSGEWPPFVSEKLEYFGVGSRIVTEAFKAVDYKVEYSFFPWDKSLQLARAGIWQGSAIWRLNKERAKSFYFSDPLFELNEVFFHLKSKKIEWSDWEDLASYKIGATGGYFYGEDFKSAEDNHIINVIWAASDTRNFKKLLAGEIDLAVYNEYVGWFLLQTQFPSAIISQFTSHPKKVGSGNLYLMISKANPGNKGIIEDFNKGLAKLKKRSVIQTWLQAAKGYTKREIQQP